MKKKKEPHLIVQKKKICSHGKAFLQPFVLAKPFASCVVNSWCQKFWRRDQMLYKKNKNKNNHSVVMEWGKLLLLRVCEYKSKAKFFPICIIYTVFCLLRMHYIHPVSQRENISKNLFAQHILVGQ